MTFDLFTQVSDPGPRDPLVFILIKSILLQRAFSLSEAQGLMWNFNFSPNGQEYPFLQMSEICLARPAVSA